MYLKSIEIQGFKSFANKIKFEFHNGITGIVGPNGSGKSNVADAVRWVLGEQKIKQLRGSKMEDVIFSGTENRKPLGFAYVAITLDNSDHKLAIDYDEVTVSRRLFRSGESEYMINGTNCRLRDINELFYDTGIGKEGYSIIGQGQIDKILSGKPEERRELFDEAAGIVKFKRRKNEALKKLKDEDQNLVRVEDILSELEKQVKPLSVQSEKAKLYLSYRDELKTCDINMFLIDIDNIRKQLKDIEEKNAITKGDYDDTMALLEKTKLEYGKLDEYIENLNNEIEEKKTFINEASINREKLEGQVLLINEQINSAKANDEYFAKRIEGINDEISDNKNSLEEQKNIKVEIEEKTKQLTVNHADTESEILSVEDEINSIDEQIENAKREIIDLLNAKSLIKSNLQRCDTLIEQINLRKNELADKIEKFKSEQNKQDDIISELQEDLKEINETIIKLTNQSDDFEKQLSDFRRQQSDIHNKIDANRVTFHKEQSRLESLKNLTERYEGYGNSIRKVMELKASKKGIIGVVADIIKVDKKYEVAIETALGGNIQNIVTNTETTAKEIIEYLKKNKFGRATFLPLSSMSNRINFSNEEALEQKGVLGLASSLVNIKEEYEGVAKYLLGRIVVVDNVDNAIALARRYKYTLRIVTLDGEFLNAGGSISGGAFKNQSNLLGRRREIEELEKKVTELKANEKTLNNDLIKCKGSLSAINEEFEKVKNAIQEQYILQNTVKMNLNQADAKKKEIADEFNGFKEESADITNQIESINENSASLNDELIASEDASANLENQVRTLSETLTKKREHMEELSTKLENQKIEITSLSQKHEFACENISRLEDALKASLEKLEEIKNTSKESAGEIDARNDAIANLKNEIANISNQIEETNTALNSLINEKEEQMKDHKEFFSKREDLSERISVLDKELFRLQNQKEKLEENNENKINYMWNEYELTYTDAKSLKNEELNNRPELNKRILELKKQIRDLGPVNVNAIEEYKEVGERYEFMNAQHEDLMKAKENLLSIIDELDKGMKKQFSEKFEEIRVEFDKVYKELFGGGKGTIELDEEEDVLEATIQIISQPPGKQLKNMMQLSGGEKALTAIALLFAIQNLKPSPFCLLDEIEAALDGSNVVRFAEYLHKLTEFTQFIVITHRRGTMESADRLYGITMQEKGISTLVSVDLLENELADSENKEELQ